MRLCVFPNDPIIAYYKKGEIKERYYNPCNIFDELYIISFTEEEEVEASKVQTIAGTAKLTIQTVGKIGLKDRKKHVDRIKAIIRDIRPDIIRAYNPLVEGWYASVCAEELKIPLFVSLHIQYDNLRKTFAKTNFKRYLGLKYSEKFIEPHVLKNADKITVVYKIIVPYVLRHGGKTPEVLYNRIDYGKYINAKPIDGLPSQLVISVGRLTSQKNHQCLIESMKEINGHLLIIGDGELYDNLTNQIQKNGLSEKITIKKSVSNNEIPRYYKAAQVFALAYDPEIEGLPIPVIEAMASGLPLVIPYPKKEYSDGLEGTAIFSERNPPSFAKSIASVLSDPNMQKQFSLKSMSKAKEFDKEIVERREADIYLELLKK